MVRQVTHLLFHNKLSNTTRSEELTAQTFLAHEKQNKNILASI